MESFATCPGFQQKTFDVSGFESDAQQRLGF